MAAVVGTALPADAGPTTWLVTGEYAKTVTVTFADTTPGSAGSSIVKVTVTNTSRTNVVDMAGEFVTLSSSAGTGFTPAAGFTTPGGVFVAKMASGVPSGTIVTATVCNAPPNAPQVGTLLPAPCNYSESGSASTT